MKGNLLRRLLAWLRQDEPQPVQAEDPRKEETRRILVEVEDELALPSGEAYERAVNRHLTDGVKAARYFGCIFGTKEQRDLAIRLMNNKTAKDTLVHGITPC